MGSQRKRRHLRTFRKTVFINTGIQAAIDESGYIFSKKRVIISPAPSDKKKSGFHFDLAMAIGILCQNGDIGVKTKNLISQYIKVKTFFEKNNMILCI